MKATDLIQPNSRVVTTSRLNGETITMIYSGERNTELESAFSKATFPFRYAQESDTKEE